MPNDIEIVDVEFSPPRVIALQQDQPGKSKQWVDLAIAVRNNSPQTGYYVISSLRNLRYDTTTQTLLVGLKESPIIEESEEAFFREPSLELLPPGESRVLRVSVPLQITRLTSLQEPHLESIDISGLEQVVVSIVYESTPFQADRSKSPRDMRSQLSAWGQVVEKTFAPKRVPAA